MGWLSGYKYRRKLTVSSDGTERTDWPISLRVYRSTETPEEGSWTVNNKIYRWRIPFYVSMGGYSVHPTQQQFWDTSDGYQAKVVVDTATLCADTFNDSGGSRFFGGTSAWYATTVEFTDDSNNPLKYWVESAYGVPVGFNTASTVYWIRCPALQHHVMHTYYMYLDYEAIPASKITGTHTAARSATLTDQNQSWTPDSLIGQRIINITASYAYGTITDNDATTVTATLAHGGDTQWDTGDTYWIASGNYGGDQCWDFFEDFNTNAADLTNFLANYTDWTANGTPVVSVGSSCFRVHGTAIWQSINIKSNVFQTKYFRSKIRFHYMGITTSYRYMVGMLSANDGWYITPRSGTSENELQQIINGNSTYIKQPFNTFPSLIELAHAPGYSTGSGSLGGRVMALYDGVYQRLPDTTGTYLRDGQNQDISTYGFAWIWSYSGTDANTFIQIDYVAISKQCFLWPLVNTWEGDLCQPGFSDCVHVQFPKIRLYSSDKLFLNNKATNWPYDIAFTDSDGTTQLYCYIDPGSLTSNTGESLLITVRVPTIPASGNTAIYCYYHGPSANQAYINGDETFRYSGNRSFDDFDNTYPLSWSPVSGNWATSVQPRPVYGSGPHRWARFGGALYSQSDGLWHFYYNGISTWPPLLSSYGDVPWTLEHAVSTDAIHWIYDKMPFWSFFEYGQPAGSGVGPSGFPISLTYDSIGQRAYITWHMPGVLSAGGYAAPADAYYSTDMINWTPDSRNPYWTPNDDPFINPSTDGWIAATLFRSQDGYWWAFWTVNKNLTTSYIRAARSSTGERGTWSTPVTIHTEDSEERYFEHAVAVYDSDHNNYVVTWVARKEALNRQPTFPRYMYIPAQYFNPTEIAESAGHWSSPMWVNWGNYSLINEISNVIICPYKVNGKWYMWTTTPYEEYTYAMDNPMIFLTTTDLTANSWAINDGNLHHTYAQTLRDTNTYVSKLNLAHGDCEIMGVFGFGAGFHSDDNPSEVRVRFKYDVNNNNWIALRIRENHVTTDGFQVEKFTGGTLSTILGSATFATGAIRYQDLGLGKLFMYRIKLYGNNIRVDVSINGGEDWILVCDTTDSQSGDTIAFETIQTEGHYQYIAVAQYAGVNGPKVIGIADEILELHPSGGNMVAEAFLAGILR